MANEKTIAKKQEQVEELAKELKEAKVVCSTKLELILELFRLSIITILLYHKNLYLFS